MKKVLVSLSLALVLAVAMVGPAAAQTETPPITGQVQSITVETDATTGATTVTVTVTDNAGVAQTVHLSVETATALGLVTTDPTTGQTVADPTRVGSDVTIDPAAVLPDAPPVEEEPQHPVGSALADFFSDVTGVDYDTIMDYHDQGAGFGVIAQALFLNAQLGGDAATFDAIMQAKLSGDYSAITLPDGSTPQNWGQFRKALLKDKDKAKNNLGSVKSGHAGDEAGNGNGNGNGNGKGNGKGDDDGEGSGTDTTTTGGGSNAGGHGNGGNGNGNGNDKDDDKGNGKGNNKP
jgi:hypothetical protein